MDADFHREHYKSEWHRYNLKRKIASLSPISLEDFEKIEAQHKQNVPMVKTTKEHYCECCRKSFSSDAALDQHVRTKKHLELMKMVNHRFVEEVSSGSKNIEKLMENVSINEVDDDGDSDWESATSEDEIDESIDNQTCLFCNTKQSSLDENVKHMSIAHSFFIPDAEYLCDLEGLITYLGEKVGLGKRCLWCCDTGKSFRHVSAVQRHMLDKGHCKMRHEAGENLLEYAEYYDYTSSYPDGEQAEVDQEVELNELEVNDELQLILPSGAVVGHRSLTKFYKQNLRDTPLPPRSDGKKDLLHNLLSQYKSLGWAGSNRQATMQKAVDLQFLAKRHLKLGMNTNKTGQMHLRNQYFNFA